MDSTRWRSPKPKKPVESVCIRLFYQKIICLAHLVQKKDNEWKKHTTVRPELILPNCLDGCGGAEAFGDKGLLSPSTMAAMLKKDMLIRR